MSGDRYGRFSPSIYETGRLVRYVPSLRGHRGRVRFLLDQQRRDGGWGGAEGHGLVPTLSATEALLSVIPNPRLSIGRDELVGSVDRGLRALFGWLNAREATPLPDTVAVEIVVPGLINEINSRLERNPLPGLHTWRGRVLAHHPQTNAGLLTGLRQVLTEGRPVPTKLLHSLEVFGDAAQGARSVEPSRDGVGCSPAATAAWLGDRGVRERRHPAVRYLETVQGLWDGPVPVAAPLATFERSWVLATLTAAGLAPTVGRKLLGSLHAAFGAYGAAGGAGLPPDADDTATALCALARLGNPREPDCLWAYAEPDGHFACFPHERTPSSSANAHVLQALDACLARDLPDRPRYRTAMARLTAWLCDRQEADGSWWDKWHASPYYATACCALALAGFGGDRVTGALGRAVDWVLDTQRQDGSWGRWSGTYEETAYAVQILCRVGHGDATAHAVGKGRACLPRLLDEPHPPLWHDKDLYTPVRIVRAEGLAAGQLAGVTTRVPAGCAAVSEP
jgi:halimadienyl-diphosphate synthase